MPTFFARGQRTAEIKANGREAVILVYSVPTPKMLMLPSGKEQATNNTLDKRNTISLKRKELEYKIGRSKKVCNY